MCNIEGYMYIWMLKYDLAKKYKEHYPNKTIPISFKTKDGINYHEDGFGLGRWFVTQKRIYNGIEEGFQSDTQRKLLEQLGLNLQMSYGEFNWYRNYNLTKIYYDYYGNININARFKTKDGINYHEDGIPIGRWVINQKYVYLGKLNGILTDEQVKLLEAINIEWYPHKKTKKLIIG